jgi:glycosyltransferase involved in cell wall biosynthesis
VNRIGVALAAYRPPPEYFAEQLASIAEQTFRDWICVITFDSPMAEARSHPLIAPFADDSRFVWIENPRRLGARDNFGKAIQTVLGLGVDAVACADQDDRWYPDKLATQASVLERAPALSIVHCDMHLLYDGQVAPKTAWKFEGRNVKNCEPRHILIRNLVSGCSSLMDAELPRRYPVIPDAASFHDYWYALVASTYGGIHSIERPLLAYRQHGANVIGAKSMWRRPATLHPVRALRGSLKAWLETAHLEAAARHEGLPIPGPALGVGALVRIGLRHVLDDPKLARWSLTYACGAVAGRLGMRQG